MGNNTYSASAQYFKSPLQQFQFYDKYSRYDSKKGRRESWSETVSRAVDYLRELSGNKLEDSVYDRIFDSILNMRSMPSMRLLAMAGDPARRDNTSIYNCFRRDTKFITSVGIKSFNDFADNDNIMVLTHTGKWKSAIVRNYGKQRLNKITIKRMSEKKVIYATPNHRWILWDSTNTTNLSRKDKLMAMPKHQFDYDDAPPLERLYWAYGFVYGDGTRLKDMDGKYKYSMIRLCGKDARFESRFLELGFTSSSSASLKGDIMIYTGTYLKTLPDLEVDSPELINAFVAGYLQADGGKNLSQTNLSEYSTLQTSNGESIDWLQHALPISGIHISRINDFTGRQTNYGTRPLTKNFGISTNMRGKSPQSQWIVDDVKETDIVEDVWCLEVEDDHSFVLEVGVVTGNCSVIPVDSVESFAEAMLISMAGCGVGFSVEKAHVSKLPVVERQTGEWSTYTVDDSSEGWGNAIRYTFKEWFEGRDVIVDYSHIRPAGSILRTKGGRASGPHPLHNLLDFGRNIILGRQGEQLTSLEAHDIMCMVGSAAISGGVRRTAMISLFDFDDDLLRLSKSDHEMFMTDADGNFIDINTQRWNANNSAVLPDRELSHDEIKGIMYVMDSTGRGEPGIFNRYGHIPERRKREEFLTNPCVTGDTLIKTSKGLLAVNELVGIPFIGIDPVTRTKQVSETGFWCTGNKLTYQICGKFGGILRASGNHRLLTNVSPETWVEVDHLRIGDNVLFDNGFESLEVDTIVSIETVGHELVYDCNLENHRYYSNGFISHNCGEILLRPRQFCNLSVAVARPDDDLDSLMDKVEVATIIGTIQSMATNFPYLQNKAWKENCEDERLLGVDITGQMDCPALNKDVFGFLKLHAINTNKEYAELLGIKQSASITCVKPSGNSSVLLDSSPGLHSRWARYYIRNVRLDGHSVIYKVLSANGVPMSPENGQTEENAITWVASFPVKAPDNAVVNGDRSAIEQLEWWKVNKLYWTEHNPSVTIYYEKSELDEIVDWVYENQGMIGGLSFLPKNDHKYNQAPYITITEEEYNHLLSIFPNIDYSILAEIESADNTTVAQELACVSGVCEIM